MATRTVLSIVVFTLSLCACEKEHRDKNRGPIDAFSIFESHNLEVRNDSVLGKGRMEFSTPLLGVNSKEHYLVRFRFLDHEKSKVTLHSHFTGFIYEDGMRIELYPEKGRLMARFSSPGYPATSPYPLFPLNPHGDNTVRIEVHDGTSSGSRVIIWNDWHSFQGEVMRPIDQIYLGNHSFDSQEEKLTFFSHGRGPFWGLELEQAQILISQRHFAYVD